MTDLMDTYTENRWTVLRNHTSNLGTVHGGNVIKWMDEAGAMSAERLAGERWMTAMVDQVSFRRPVPVGDIALAEAFVNDAGRTSVRERVRGYREDSETAERELTTESYMVFVAIDEDREPTPVPDLTVATDEGARLLQEARAGEEQRAEA